MRGALIRAWHSITEPRHVKVVYWIYYVIAIVAGAYTFIRPPELVEITIGLQLTWAFSAFLLLGGLAGAVSVFRGWWWLERLGDWSCLLGIGVFQAVIVHQILHYGSTSGPAQFTVGVFATGMFVLRLLTIRKYSFEPRIEPKA